MNKKLRVILFSCLCMNVFGQQYSQKFSDVNYVGDGQGYHNLDIYLPKATKAAYPVVIHIYGSAFMSNNGKGSADLGTVVASLLDAGFAVVTPNHRSSSDAVFPAQIQDVKAVIRFLRGNSATYKLDTSFVGISGFSSGGQLASLAGTTRNVRTFTRGGITMDLEGSLGNHKSQKSYVNAVCDWSGPTDFLKMDSCGSSFNNNAADSPASKLIGGAIQQNKDRSQLTNPITYVDPTDPAFLIIHGTSDNIVPYCQSTFLDRALKANEVQSQLLTVQNGGHSVSSTYLSQMVQFFLGQVTVTSITSAEEELRTGIYVDALNQTLYVEGLPENVQARYEIIDMAGVRVKGGVWQEGGIPISSLNAGIYLVNVLVPEHQGISMKFFKN